MLGRCAGAALFTVAVCMAQSPSSLPETAAGPATTPEHIADPVPLEERAVPVTAPGPGEAGVPIALSLDSALLTAIANNRSIEIGRVELDVNRTYVPEARAAFDPLLLGSVSAGRSKEQRASTTDERSSKLSLLSRISGSSVTSGSGSSGQNTTPLLDAYQRALSLGQEDLNDINAIVAYLEQPEHPFTKTRDSDGFVTVQNYLPTGTLVFLTVDMSHSDTNRAPDDYRGAWSLGVSQALLQGRGLDVNLVELKQARNLVAQSEAEFRRLVLEISRLVEDTYWELVLAHEVLKIREFALTLADEQLKRNEDLYSVGKVVVGDVMSAKAERASRTADLAGARAGIRNQTLALIRLLNPGAAGMWQLEFTPLDRPEANHVVIDAEVSHQLAMLYRPELDMSKLELANRSLDVVRARNGLLPRLDLTASYGRTSRGTASGDASAFLDSSTFDNFRIGLNFETSILYRGERARHRRARFLEDEAALTIADVEQAVSTQVRQAAVEVQQQWERISATQEAVKSRLEELRIAQDRNAVGKATNLDVQIVQRNLIQAEVDEATARVRYSEALTALYAAEGTLLERRGIRLNLESDDGEQQ
ncbi:MAG: TolC family protein [Candidatus Hydrogenedentes bacterium]|nr:TolC family protein [Candidatus Hydrogenedentota bacterium]